MRVPSLSSVLAFATFLALSSHAYQVWRHTQRVFPAGAPQRECSTIPRDADAALRRFSQLLQFKTVADPSTEDHRAEGCEQEFDDLLAFLPKAYPEVHRVLKVEEVGLASGSRLFTWRGSNPSLKPVLFISHFDVVPVTCGTEQDWTHPPFSGAIADGYVWGRGALDVKYGVAGLLEAATTLLMRGFQPERTIMISFGSDEEIGGTGGAAQIAEHLAKQKIELEAIVDEGGLIMKQGIRGLTEYPIALVGTAEKLYTSVVLDLASAGGHSSMPPIDGSSIASQVSRIVHAVDAAPPPAEVRPPMSEFFKAIAPYTLKHLVPLRPLLQHSGTWPFNKLLAQLFVRVSRELAALMRTTVAVTHMAAGVADNVLPNLGKLTFNMRSNPGVPRKDTVKYLEERMGEARLQPGAKLEVTEASHHGPFPDVSPADCHEFVLIKQAIQEYWRQDDKAVAVAPYLLSGGTDSKHFAQLTDKIFRFVPYAVTSENVNTIHSTNERVRASDFTMGVCTYARMMELLSSH